jgi:Tol biopolymer transport system component
MALRLAPIDQAGADRVAVNGQPNYASWSPDGSALVVHIGGSGSTAFVGTYVLTQTQLTKFEQNPAAFQAPFWSPRGEAQWLYARQAAAGAAAGSELVLGNGQQVISLAQFNNGIAFGGSPDGQAVAYALNTPDSFLYRGLVVIDRAGQHPHVYYKSDVLAFFWSPDGQQLAFLTGALGEPGQTGRAGGLAERRVQQNSVLQATWHVVNVANGAITDLNTFEPSESLLYVIQYFDQFAQSIALWSPDSRWLVYTGKPLLGKQGVYIIDTQQPAAPPQYVGSGEFAIWSWK